MCMCVCVCVRGDRQAMMVLGSKTTPPNPPPTKTARARPQDSTTERGGAERKHKQEREAEAAALSSAYEKPNQDGSAEECARDAETHNQDTSTQHTPLFQGGDKERRRETTRDLRDISDDDIRDGETHDIRERSVCARYAWCPCVHVMQRGGGGGVRQGVARHEDAIKHA